MSLWFSRSILSMPSFSVTMILQPLIAALFNLWILLWSSASLPTHLDHFPSQSVHFVFSSLIISGLMASMDFCSDTYNCQDAIAPSLWKAGLLSFISLNIEAFITTASKAGSPSSIIVLWHLSQTEIIFFFSQCSWGQGPHLPNPQYYTQLLAWHP